LEQIGPPLVAHAQPTKAEQPGKRSLDHPAMPPQPLGGVDPAAGKAWGDAASTKGAPQWQGIVRLVAMQLGRALARPSRLPTRADDRWDGINEREELDRVVGVGRRGTYGRRDAVPIHHEVVLGSPFAAVDRVRPRLLAPLLARTLSESTLARLQSIAASPPSQYRSVSCNRSQTPAACQSRNRRQQIAPLPQPSSVGSKRHGQPVRRTKTMPHSAARLGTRGRPPLGFGGSSGSNGSIASQRSSGTRAEAFMARHHATPPWFWNTLLLPSPRSEGRGALWAALGMRGTV
jgi:hypothetical protein